MFCLYKEEEREREREREDFLK